MSDHISAIISQVKIEGRNEQDFHANVAEFFESVSEYTEILEEKVERVPDYAVDE